MKKVIAKKSSKKNAPKNAKKVKTEVKTTKPSAGKVISREATASGPKPTRIDMNEIGAEIANGVAEDFGCEVTAGLSKNGRCYVVEFQHAKYHVALLVFPNGKVFVKAQLCENAIFNNCVRTFVGTPELTVAALARKFVRLAFFKEMHDKALELPYVPSSKEAVEE